MEIIDYSDAKYTKNGLLYFQFLIFPLHLPWNCTKNLKIWSYFTFRKYDFTSFFKVDFGRHFQKNIFYYINFSDLMTSLPMCCQSREKWVLFSLDITRKHHGDSFGCCQNHQLFLTRCFPQANIFFQLQFLIAIFFC